MLFVYVLTIIAGCFVQNSFSPIAAVVAEIYEVDKIVVNTFVSLYFITLVCFSFPAVTFLEKFGLQITFKMCGTIIVSGSWLRYLSLSVQEKGKEKLIYALGP